MHLPSVTEGPLEVRGPGADISCLALQVSKVHLLTVQLCCQALVVVCALSQIIMEMEGTIRLSFRFTFSTHFLPSCGENQPFVVIRHLKTDNWQFHGEEKGQGN